MRFVSSSFPNEDIESGIGMISLMPIEQCVVCGNSEEAQRYFGDFHQVSIDGDITAITAKSSDETNVVFFDEKVSLLVQDDDPRLYEYIVERITQRERM